MTQKQFWLISSVIGFYLMVDSPVNSQIIPDGIKTNTSVLGNCQSSCDITGGTFAGQNLFHSFQEFNVLGGENVYFADPGVANIFSRVTGGNLSSIFGTLGVSGGDANLFLLNPNGIIFGQGATLDINGSFVATTADQIQFGDRGFFSARPNSQENLALLTVSPSAFFFNQMGRNNPINNPITANSGTLLTVPTQKNLTLLGAQATENIPGITLVGSTIQSPQGNVSIGAVKGDGEIGIDANFQLEFPDDVTRGDISFLQSNAIDVSGLGAGNVQLQGNNITLIEESQIVANTLGNIDGGSINVEANNLTLADNSLIVASTAGRGNSPNINITANESVDLIGRDMRAFQEFLVTTLSGGDRTNNISTSIYTFSLAEGAAGDINIDSKNLAIQNGAWILASTLNKGKTGNITINTADTLTLDGSGLITGSAVGSTGNVATLTIDSNNVLIQNGGVVSSTTLGQGEGGNISLTVADSMQLLQSLPNGIIPTGIYFYQH